MSTTVRLTMAQLAALDGCLSDGDGTFVHLANEGHFGNVAVLEVDDASKIVTDTTLDAYGESV